MKVLRNVPVLWVSFGHCRNHRAYHLFYQLSARKETIIATVKILSKRITKKIPAKEKYFDCQINTPVTKDAFHGGPQLEICNVGKNGS